MPTACIFGDRAQRSDPRWAGLQPSIMRISSWLLPTNGNRITTCLIGTFYANWHPFRTLKGTRAEASFKLTDRLYEWFYACLLTNVCLTKWQSWVGTSFHLNLAVRLWDGNNSSPIYRKLPYPPQNHRIQPSLSLHLHPHNVLLRFRPSSLFY